MSEPVPHSEYQELPQRRPDVYSNSWYREQFRGVMHSLNRCNAEYASADERIVRLESQLSAAVLEIGKLRAELEEKLDRVREAYKELKHASSIGSAAGRDLG